MASLTDISSQLATVLSPIEQFLGLGSGGVSVNTQYSIFLDFQGVTIQFPVMPPEITAKYPSTNQTYNVLALGEIVQPRLPGLSEYRWESFFPGKVAPWINTAGAFQPPEFYITTINGYKTAGNVVRLIISRWADGGKLFDTNVQAVVEDFEVIEKGGEVGDFYYSIYLKEYRPYAAKKATAQTGTTTSTTPNATTAANSTAATTASTATVITQVQRPVDKVIPTYYTIQSADTLWKVCKQQLGDGSLYQSVLTKNGLSSTSSITSGMRIQL